ncbi:MAG: hypothetical protein KC464_16030 [Myxococcales bacterium]|nr:hypothetical protein [Myxococcales bacterium]
MAERSPAAPAVLRPVRSPLRVTAPALAVSAAALCFVTGVAVTTSMTGAAPPRRPDPCALPAGMDLGQLAERDRAAVVRAAMACVDYEHGRIGAEDYRAARLRPAAMAIAAAPPPVMWAATVREASSEYSDGSWSAAQVLGPPDVYPVAGDQVSAWASRGADDRVETLEVGLAAPHRLSAVEVYETFNAGAVSRIELIGVDGSHQVAYDGAAAALGSAAFRRHVEVGCTDVAITAIRVTIDSPAVPGWNEIDAIGGVPCDAR